MQFHPYRRFQASCEYRGIMLLRNRPQGQTNKRPTPAYLSQPLLAPKVPPAPSRAGQPANAGTPASHSRTSKRARVARVALTVAYKTGDSKIAGHGLQIPARADRFLLDAGWQAANNRLRLGPVCHGSACPAAVDQARSCGNAMSASSPGLLRCQDSCEAVTLTFVESRLLDEARIRELGEQLLSAAQQAGTRTLILSMANVEHVSSHMVAKLLAVQQRVQAQGGKMMLCDLRPRIYATLRTANLDKVLDVHPLDEGTSPSPRRADDATDSGATMPLEE